MDNVAFVSFWVKSLIVAMAIGFILYSHHALAMQLRPHFKEAASSIGDMVEDSMAGFHAFLIE